MSLRNPVKYPVKYYNWQDDQAPQLTDADGVIKTILKACLVTGYGSKAGAGWTALFEDAYRIVLRRPLRTGNPPDIKIENGTFAVNGSNVTRHRIVAQNNPNALDDTNELFATNLLARGGSYKEWYCIVTDFAFLLCYQVADYAFYKNSVLYIGGMQKLSDRNDDNFFVQCNDDIGSAGSTNYAYHLFVNSVYFKNIIDLNAYNTKNILNINKDELYFDNDYIAQNILLDAVAAMPFYTSLCANYTNTNTSLVSINGRNMLRYVNAASDYNGKRVLYIPLDYWEL